MRFNLGCVCFVFVCALGLGSDWIPCESRPGYGSIMAWLSHVRVCYTWCLRGGVSCVPCQVVSFFAPLYLTLHKRPFLPPCRSLLALARSGVRCISHPLRLIHDSVNGTVVCVLDVLLSCISVFARDLR